VNYIAFSGGGAALAAVLGGQLSAAVRGYAEFAGQIEAGQLRVLAISSPARIAGIDAPTLRESGVALDLANWRAIVAPPGLSDVEQRALIDRMRRMAASAPWQAALTRNGWDDQFLAGAPFRQFLLSEQSRIEDVLRRLAANDTQAASALTFTMTSMTLPAATGVIFITVLALVIVNISRRSIAIDPTGRRMVAVLIASLIATPLIFVRIGFVPASALLFAITASALRAKRPASTPLAIDIIVGTAFAIVLFLVFTRGLGVSLPGLPF
jgi:hypothetical protein